MKFSYYYMLSSRDLTRSLQQTNASAWVWSLFSVSLEKHWKWMLTSFLSQCCFKEFTWVDFLAVSSLQTFLKIFSLSQSRGREGRHTDSSEQPERPKIGASSSGLFSPSSLKDCVPPRHHPCRGQFWCQLLHQCPRRAYCCWCFHDCDWAKATGDVCCCGGDKSGKGLVTDHQFEGARSKLFDSIHLPAGQYVETLRKSSRVLRWVREVLGHLKAIGAVDKAVALAKDGCGVRRDAVCRLR